MMAWDVLGFPQGSRVGLTVMSSSRGDDAV